jgi:hypothetical protein
VVATQDVAHGQFVNMMPQIRQGTLEAAVACMVKQFEHALPTAFRLTQLEGSHGNDG